MPGQASPEDTQPVQRPDLSQPVTHSTGSFNTGGFAVTGQHHLSNFDPPEADAAPTLPPELVNASIPPMVPQLQAPPAGRLTTGRIDTNSPQHDPFMTGRLEAITNPANANQHLSDAFSEEPDRVSYGIWGAAVGCIIGIFFGVLNALFEGVWPSDNQGPLIIFTLVGLFIGGVVSATQPRRVAQIVRDLFYFYR